MWWWLFACQEATFPRSASIGVEPVVLPAAATSCDPLDPSVCALPWPSAYYQTRGPGRPQLAEDSLPVDRSGNQLSPDALGFVDGYSVNTPLLTFIEDLDPSNLPGPDRIADSLAADAPIVLVDAASGERVPLFAELDAHAPPGERLLSIRPAAPLAHGRRYVVGLRGLSTSDGAPVTPSPHFAALRDGGGDDPDLRWRRTHFDADVFPVLAAAGVDRSELQLAWDFWTGTIEGVAGDALLMRDAALDEVGPEGPAYVIDAVVDDDCSSGARIGRTVEGRFVDLPRFTESAEPPTRIARGPDDRPLRVGTSEAPFIVRVPCSVLADPAGGATLLDYGHGLLGDLSEARTSHLSAFADDHRMVVFAMNWTGMSFDDVLPITGILLAGGSDFPAMPERSVQGLVERIAGVRAARGRLRDDPSLTVDGQPVIGDELVYYGISQGGIMGAAYLALSPDHRRGVFGVTGGPYSLLLPRSNDFTPFYEILQGRYPDFRESGLVIAVMQSAWDASEGGGYAAHLTRDPLPGSGDAKQVLAQVAIGDGQVTTLGAHHQARAWGAVTLNPSVRAIYGVPTVDGPTDAPVLVEWSYTDGAAEPIENLPPDAAGDTHECPRREPAAQAQIAAFFATGLITHTCDGPCVSTRAGLCD